MIRKGYIRVVFSFLIAGGLIAGTENQTLGHNPGLPSVPRKALRREVHVPVHDFILTDQTGKLFKFKKLRGKVVLLAFVYTSCPDVCPLVTAGMRLLQKKLGEAERHSVFLVSVTTDPEVDSPKVLRSYAERYQVDFSNWSLLTGDPQSLTRVWKNFGVKTQRKARGLVNHTSLTALVDGKGTMRFAYHGASPDYKTILRDMRRLLASH
ncbi:MAG: SCO family protein [Candidatus Binatia bacterium]